MLELLHNLKERLEFSALGSINLLKQDFKLKKALEEFKTISSSSKVLEKIYLATEALIEKDSENKAVEFLDLLALINAVILTQTTTIEEQELQDIAGAERNYQKITNKKIAAFYHAVYESGPGRQEFLNEFLADATIMEDFRVFQGIIHGLKDQYIRPLLIEKLTQCDENIIKYLKELAKESSLDEMIVLYIANKISDGAEDEHIKQLYMTLENEKKITKKIKEDLSSLVSIVTPSKINFDFFKKVYQTTDIQSLATLKLILMSMFEGENYINEITEEIITYLPQKKDEYKDALALIYSTDTKFTDILLDEFDLEMDVKEDSSQEVNRNRNNKRYTLLFLGINKPNQRWFNTILDCLTSKSWFLSVNLKNEKQNYTKEASIYLICNIVAEYVLIHKNNVNKDFLEKVYDLVGENKVGIQFLMDLEDKSANELYDTYAPYLMNKQSDYIATSLMNTILCRMNYEEQKYDLTSMYYAALENTYYQVQSGKFVSNAYRIKDITHDAKLGKGNIKEALDPRWYKVMVEAIDIADKGILLPHGYMGSFTTKDNWSIPVNSMYRNARSHFIKDIVFLFDEKNEIEIKALALMIKEKAEKTNAYYFLRYCHHVRYIHI